MRLVLDTNVVASGLLWDGPPRRLIRAGRTGEHLLFSSTPLLAELTDILSRTKFEKKVAASQLSVDQIVDLYAQLAALVRPVSTPRLAPDPDDDVVIGTGLAAKADFVVTGDRGLLSVVQYEGIRIVSVSEALQGSLSS
jgi:putative PIN family toxin of toxin-antitoxin system